MKIITKIVINSHRNSEIALKKMLDSMAFDSNWNVFVCIGGFYEYETYKIVKEGHITYIYCNHNSIDYTGLIALLDLFYDSDDTYLYLHDTCSVGPKFYELLSNISIDGESGRIWYPSMNMGIYTSTIIRKNINFLLERKNTLEENSQKFKSDGVHFEDFIFKNDSTNVKLVSNNNVTGPTDIYNTGIMRITEYYDGLDLYKYKANWEIKNVYELRN